MAFTLEDGSIVADANSLCDLAFADAYFTDRGVATWTGTNTVKQQALIKATDYIEQRWGPRFIGTIVDEDQALSWPRKEVVDKQGRVVDYLSIPVKLKQAVAEYALRALGTDLFLTPTIDPTGTRVDYNRTKVGPIETEVHYSDRDVLQVIKPWPAADRLIAEYTYSNIAPIRA
jgi:hypothetical protein